MNFTKKFIAAALLAVAAVSTPALADRGGHRGGGWQHGYHGHGGGWHRGYGNAGAIIGGAIVAGALLSPWYYPGYYPGYYSTYPTVVEVSPAAPTVYVQQPQAVQPAAVAAADPGSWWYYCNESRAYYPYVKECASPWQRVAPTPNP